MKAYDPATGAGTVGDRRRDDERAAQRAPRRGQHGPIGFGHVLTMVRRKPGQGQHEHERDQQREREQAEQRGLHLDGSSAAATATPAAAVVDRELAALIRGDLAGIDQDASSLAAQNAKAAHEAYAPSAARVTPERAMQLIEDAARELRGENGARELHLELDPAHLGPIVVKLVVDRGRIRSELRAQKPEAAERLAAGSRDLRDRLASLGYAHAEVDVSCDGDLAR